MGPDKELLTLQKLIFTGTDDDLVFLVQNSYAKLKGKFNLLDLAILAPGLICTYDVDLQTGKTSYDLYYSKSHWDISEKYESIVFTPNGISIEDDMLNLSYIVGLIPDSKYSNEVNSFSDARRIASNMLVPTSLESKFHPRMKEPVYH